MSPLLAVGAGTGMLAGFVWWFIAASPIVLDPDRQVTKLDDPEIGRMHRVERCVEKLEAWRPRIISRR